MSSSTPPIIAFELGVGEFRIVTPEAVYQIKVCHDLVEATKALEAPPAEADGNGHNGGKSPTFYQEISEELFDKVGRLARSLSVSVEDLPGQINAPDLDETDQQLESAKGQLEEIVKLTEKASMSIMDSADQIQTDMDQLRGQLDILQNLDLMAELNGAAPPAAAEGAAQVNICDKAPLDPTFFDKLTELKAYISGLMAGAAGPAPADPVPEPAAEPEEPEAAPEPAPAPEPEPEPAPAAPQMVTVVRFDVDVVFQTLYELCTNESVKDHIKTMREAQEAAFNSQEVADKLSEMAPTVDEEDGFYNFPIPAVLKTLYAATGSEDFKTTLKKMNQTAASIFLDSVLPIEGETVEVEVPGEAPAAPPEPEPEPQAAAPEPEPDPEPEPAPVAEPEPAAPADEPAPGGSGCSLAELQTIETLAAEIERLGLSARTGAAPAEGGGVVVSAGQSGGLYTSILTQDRDTIVKTVTMAHNLIQQTGGHLTHILETLSFQDLSGQRIMKVVSLIGDIQMQLLSILVSVNTKLKVHQESGEEDVKNGKVEQMAQEEVDKALEKVAGNSALLGPGAESRLDQGAVNDLLSQLGF